MENFPANFIGDFLRSHNHYRAVHNAPPLQIEDKLNEYAQEWADVLATEGALDYRPETEYGENVFASHWKDVSPQISPKDPLEAWYRGGRYFRYGEEQPKNVEYVRHFTQMVWRGTRSMGFGMASGFDGKIYFVCNYNPAGNVQGEFAENVLPPTQDTGELLRHEAEGIRTVEIRPDVARSMERLYAVPSEKLRVWSIWLTKIGEIADEWQKWLRAHIDLATRLSERLQEVADKSGEVSSDEKERSTAETVDSSVVADGETEGADEASGRDATASASNVESSARLEEEDDERAESAEESEAAVAPESEELMTWPIGKPWQPVGPKIIEEEEFEKLPLPTTEQEMREFLKEFTHQATIYRSYYKHWRETADQAIKSVGGRRVMASYVVQGKMDKLPKEVPKKSGRVSVQREQSDLKPRDKSDSDGSEFHSALDTPVAPSETETESPETAETPESPQTEDPPPESPQTEDPPPESPQAAESPGQEVPESKDKASTPAKQKARAKSAVSKTKAKRPTIRSSRRISKMECPETVESFRDKARAAEPIPYFFYLKTEPDAEIAIEHDDEQVIPADPDRESIVGDYRKVHFNLTDKPCKGGKPWV